jgi:hypothetical protein
MRNAGMVAALQRWRENTTESKAMVAKSTRVVLRWKLQVVVRCLEAWRELTAQEVRKRDLMGRIVARMLQRSLSLAMDLWQQHLSAARRALAAALELWSTSLSDLARQRNIMDRILRRILDAKMAAGQTAVGELAACLSDPCVYALTTFALCLHFLTCG